MGPAVLNGGLAMFLTFVPLVASTTIGYRRLFKVFLLGLASGIYYSVVFLPVALGCFGGGGGGGGFNGVAPLEEAGPSGSVGESIKVVVRPASEDATTKDDRPNRQ